MQALRITQNVAQDGYLHIAVPPEMSRRCEVIVLPLEEHLEKEHTIQQRCRNSQVCTNVLGADSEDVME